jgi:hypothetical protein
MSDESLAEPLSLRALLDEAVKQARRHFKSVYWPVALPLALMGALAPLAQPRWLSGLAEPGAGDAMPFASLADALAFAAFVWIMLSLYGLGYAALQVGAVDALADRPVSMARAWVFMFRPAVLGTVLLSWLAFAAGLTCCVLPGVYVALLLALIVPVMAEEGRFGTGAFRRSYALLTYNPRRDWGADPRVKAFLVLLAGMLLGYALTFVVQLPVIVVQQIMMFRSVAAGQPVDSLQIMARLTWLQVPSNFLGMLVQTAVYLYMSFGLTLLFFDLRRRKEGADLEAAVARLAERGPAGA